MASTKKRQDTSCVKVSCPFVSYLKIFFLALLRACGVIPMYLAISFNGTCLKSHFSLFNLLAELI